jgi:hypothetical protein
VAPAHAEGMRKYAVPTGCIECGKAVSGGFYPMADGKLHPEYALRRAALRRAALHRIVHFGHRVTRGATDNARIRATRDVQRAPYRARRASPLCGVPHAARAMGSCARRHGGACGGVWNGVAWKCIA